MNELKAVTGLTDIVFTFMIHVHQTHRLNVLMDVDLPQTNVAAGKMFSTIMFLNFLNILAKFFLLNRPVFFISKLPFYLGLF